MVDERILTKLRRRRELIIRNIEIYKAEKAGLLGRQHYYDDEVQRLLDKNRKEDDGKRVAFIDKKLKEFEKKAKKINRVLLSVKEDEIKAKGEEKKKSETKFLIVFLALLAITGLFLFSDYLKLEFGPTGFVVSRGTTNITGQQPRGSVIGGNITIELRPGDIIPNDTLVNVSFEGQENTTYLEYFIRTSNELLSASVEPNSSTSPFIDVDAVSSWEGLTGYGWSVNETPVSPFDGGNITVNLDDLFPSGLTAPSVGGVYNLILNATLENETGELVVTSTTQIDVAAIPDDPAFMNVNSTAANAQNYSNETLNFNAFVNDANINDALTCYINPYVGGINQTANEDSKSCADPESFVYELNSANTTKGQLHSFALTVCDIGGECSNVVFSENLTIVNSPPFFIDFGPINTDEDINIETDLTANITQLDSDILSISYSVNESGLFIVLIDNSTDNLTIIPNANEFGARQLTLTVYDTEDAASASFTNDVVIAPVNDAPTAAGDLSNSTQDEDFGIIDNLISKTDFDVNWTDAEDATPSSYTIIAQSNTTTSCYFDGTNNLDCESVANLSGTDLYTFELNDSGNLGARYDWQIVVNSVNDAPFPPLLNLPENNTQIEEGVFTVELNWSNSTDVEGSSLTYYLEIWNDSAATQIMYVNSSITETDNTTEDLVTFPSETRDYFWRALANDGTDNSSFSDLRNISLRVSANTAPNDPIGVIINSTTADQLNQTNETLDMNFYCDDPEADTMNWNLLSFRDGIEQFSLSGTCGDNVYTVVKLESENTSISELWSFGVVIDDGSLNNTGGYIYSNNLTIENTKPSITDVSLAGQTWAPLEGDVRIIEVSFLADDIDGAGHLDNTTAKLNASYFSIIDNTLLSNENSSCSSSSIDTDTINYTCEIRMEYFWDHTSTLAQGWTVDAEVADINSSFALNSSNQNDGVNWTYSELVAANLSDTSLSWASTFPGGTNLSSTTNQTWENTGNSLSLNIITTIIDLGASGTTTYIPAGNFSVFNITNTDSVECDFLNQSAAVTPGVAPLVGINDTAIRHLTNTLRRGGGSGNFGLTNICLFDVPADLITADYNTSFGGSWTIVEEDSGE